MLRALAAAVFLAAVAAAPLRAQEPGREARPNVLWIYVEDLSPWLSCYGDTTLSTPSLDALAARGSRFERAYMPAAVCSAVRSALITGAMQTTLGLHNHRSARPPRGGGDYDAIELPDGVDTLPERLRGAGYFTFNQGKTDYNFVRDLDALYDRHDPVMDFARIDLDALFTAAGGRPFFGQIQLRGGKNRPSAETTDRAAVAVPPYYPDIPLVREEIAHHYDCVRETDAEVAAILAALGRAGLLDRTVVFFFSDHGFRMHRHKQFLYEGGIRVPLIAAGPGVPAGVRRDLVSGIDITATTVALAGLAPPAHAEGRDLLAADRAPREYVVAARDRCDYSIERIRAVVTADYKYLRNALTDRPYMQPQYRDPWPVTAELRRLAAAGELTPEQAAFFGPRKPAEELYDLRADPHETRDLAADPGHAAVLAHHRQLLDDWIAATGDRGQHGEPAAGLRAVLARWGEKCVNPEYARVRAVLADPASRPRVLILGDSISMGYLPVVQRILAGEAIVRRPQGNCEGTTKGVAHLDEWLAIEPGDWDVIHFNFGLHDLKRVQPDGRNSNDPADPRQAEPGVYERQLRAIGTRLRATGAEVVFATTTPVPPGGVRPHREPDDVGRYNAIARRVMAELDIAVDDLCGFVAPRLARVQRPVDVHFTAQGSAELGRAVADQVRAALTRRGR